MKVNDLIRYVIITVLACCLSINLLLAQITGKVIRISDGDTFTILTADKQQVKIRLHGIDCPEKGQTFGQKAKNYTSALAFGKIVKAYEKDIDRYGRTIAIVYLPAGRILNEELLKAGYAWHYKKYDKNAQWAALEQGARANKRGLWNEMHAVAPWEWRRK